MKRSPEDISREKRLTNERSVNDSTARAHEEIARWLTSRVDSQYGKIFTSDMGERPADFIEELTRDCDTVDFWWWLSVLIL